MPLILLASESVVRKFIFDQAKLPYQLAPARVDESAYDNLPVGERVVKLAEIKARKIAQSQPGATIIAADTLTTDSAGRVQNKLSHGDDPFGAALSLRGKTVGVHTGCCVYVQSTGYVTTYVTSSITYGDFTEQTLLRLIKGDNAAIRSGALGMFYDAPGFTLIEHIEGSYTGALGLPMEFVYAQLARIEQAAQH